MTVVNLKLRKANMKTKIENYLKAPIDSGLVIVFSFFMIGWGLAIFWLYVRAAFRGAEFPYNTFLPAPVTRFGDFYLMYDEWARLGLGGVGYGLSYLPATYIFVHVLRTITENPYDAIVYSQIPLLAFLPIIVFFMFRRKGFAFSLIVFLIILFSYPNIIAWHTGNIESWIGLLLILASFSWALNKKYLFVILIGLAGAMKIYPLIFLLMLVVKREKDIIRSALLAFVTIFGTNIIAITFLKNGILANGIGYTKRIIQSLIESQQMYQELMWYSGSGNAFGHSLLNSIHLFFGENYLPTKQFYYVPGIILIMIFIFVLILNKGNKLTDWKLLTIFGVSACLFVPTSSDYKLFYLIPGLLVVLYKQVKLNLFDFFIVIMIASTLFPKPYLYVNISPFANATAYLTTLTLLIILVALLSDLFFSKSSLDVSEPDRYRII